jgi:isopentenyl-diphosphate Delta-isomerase
MFNMAEELEIFDLNGKLLGFQERNKFYAEIKEEFKKKGKISRQVKSIRLILMNSLGKIYLQKRSKTKSENSGLYDKTVGGHVSKGDTFNMTAIRECAEELGFPACVLSNEEFDRSTKVTDLNIVGVFRKVDEISNFESVRIDKKGNKFVQPYINATYIGYYNGTIRFVDGESSGIEVFSLEELKEEIKQNPDKFTEDLKFMIKNYEKYLHPIN